MRPKLKLSAKDLESLLRKFDIGPYVAKRFKRPRCDVEQQLDPKLTALLARYQETIVRPGVTERRVVTDSRNTTQMRLPEGQERRCFKDRRSSRSI